VERFLGVAVRAAARPRLACIARVRSRVDEACNGRWHTQSLVTWLDKMAERIGGPGPDDIEANYRRAWLLTQILEDYFHLRTAGTVAPRKPPVAQGRRAGHVCHVC
jgi:hypothetical protein